MHGVGAPHIASMLPDIKNALNAMFGQSNCLHLINFSVANIQTIFLIPITQVVFYKKRLSWKLPSRRAVYAT